jgi:hypothetical protein
MAVIWKRAEAPPLTLRGAKVLFKLVKPTLTTDAGQSFTVDETSSLSVLPEPMDATAATRRPTSTPSWDQTEAWQKPRRSLVKVLMYMTQPPEMKTTKFGDQHMQVSGTDKTSQSMILNAWNIWEDDGHVQSGRSYVVHGLRVAVDKYRFEGWMQIQWDRQYSAFEDARDSASNT